MAGAFVWDHLAMADDQAIRPVLTVDAWVTEAPQQPATEPIPDTQDEDDTP